MRRRLQRALPLLLLPLALSPLGCGKRADPLAPYLKTPQPPTGLEVSQIGDTVEIRLTAPRTTTENRPLPVIEMEYLQAPATGDFGRTAASLLREEVAPGELRVKRFPLPPAPVRFSARAFNGGARSDPPAPVAFLPALVPAQPTGLRVENLPTGVELSWTNPPGAEPWPSPTPVPTPTPTPTPTPSPEASPAPSPSAPSSPAPGPAVPAPTTPPTRLDPPPSDSALPLQPEGPKPEAGAEKAPQPPDRPASPSTSPSPAPSPTPALTLPSAIRIFRTDGALRPATPPLQASSWLDSSPKPGETPCYSISYAASLKPPVESAPTEEVCVEVKDLVPPDPPERLLGDIGDGFVELSWLPSPSADVDHYRIYRSAEWEARALIIQTEGLLLRVRDLRMTQGPRTYEVTAVDQGGNESQPTEELRLIVP